MILGVHVAPGGFFMSDDGILVASPDGRVLTNTDAQGSAFSCEMSDGSTHVTRLLEIKCPFRKVYDVTSSHYQPFGIPKPYLVQMQGQMAMANAESCDFFVLLHPNGLVSNSDPPMCLGMRVWRSREFWAWAEPRLRQVSDWIRDGPPPWLDRSFSFEPFFDFWNISVEPLVAPWNLSTMRQLDDPLRWPLFYSSPSSPSQLAAVSPSALRSGGLVSCDKVHGGHDDDDDARRLLPRTCLHLEQQQEQQTSLDDVRFGLFTFFGSTKPQRVSKGDVLWFPPCFDGGSDSGPQNRPAPEDTCVEGDGDFVFCVDRSDYDHGFIEGYTRACCWAAANTAHIPKERLYFGDRSHRRALHRAVLVRSASEADWIRTMVGPEGCAATAAIGGEGESLPSVSDASDDARCSVGVYFVAPPAVMQTVSRVTVVSSPQGRGGGGEGQGAQLLARLLDTSGVPIRGFRTVSDGSSVHRVQVRLEGVGMLDGEDIVVDCCECCVVGPPPIPVTLLTPPTSSVTLRTITSGSAAKQRRQRRRESQRSSSASHHHQPLSPQPILIRTLMHAAEASQTSTAAPSPSTQVMPSADNGALMESKCRRSSSKRGRCVIDVDVDSQQDTIDVDGMMMHNDADVTPPACMTPPPRRPAAHSLPIIVDSACEEDDRAMKRDRGNVGDHSHSRCRGDVPFADEHGEETVGGPKDAEGEDEDGDGVVSFHEFLRALVEDGGASCSGVCWPTTYLQQRQNKETFDAITTFVSSRRFPFVASSVAAEDEERRHLRGDCDDCHPQHLLQHRPSLLILDVEDVCNFVAVTRHEEDHAFTCYHRSPEHVCLLQQAVLPSSVGSSCGETQPMFQRFDSADMDWLAEGGAGGEEGRLSSCGRSGASSPPFRVVLVVPAEIPSSTSWKQLRWAIPADCMLASAVVVTYENCGDGSSRPWQALLEDSLRCQSMS